MRTDLDETRMYKALGLIQTVIPKMRTDIHSSAPDVARSLNMESATDENEKDADAAEEKKMCAYGRAITGDGDGAGGPHAPWLVRHLRGARSMAKAAPALVFGPGLILA